MDKQNAPAYTKEGNASKQNEARIDERHYRYVQKIITRQKLQFYNKIFLFLTKNYRVYILRVLIYFTASRKCYVRLLAAMRALSNSCMPEVY